MVRSIYCSLPFILVQKMSLHILMGCMLKCTNILIFLFFLHQIFRLARYVFANSHIKRIPSNFLKPKSQIAVARFCTQNSTDEMTSKSYPLEVIQSIYLSRTKYCTVVLKIATKFAGKYKIFCKIREIFVDDEISLHQQ